MSVVVVVGPQGCGKTRNARVLRMHFGCSQVLDDVADWRTARPAPGTLVLAQEIPPAAWATIYRATVVPYDVAMGGAAKTSEGPAQ